MSNEASDSSSIEFRVEVGVVVDERVRSCSASSSTTNGGGIGGGILGFACAKEVISAQKKVAETEEEL